MRQHHRQPPHRPSQRSTVLDRLNPNVAGMDCGAARHFVAVPVDRAVTPVQSFATVTSDLRRLVHWLKECRVTSVAMEATGVYWIPIYEMLEADGFEVLLVNARHLKSVPGRKSDVSDCEWLRELHSVGLLRGSFRPPDAIDPPRVSPPSANADRERRHLRATHAEGARADESPVTVGGQ